MEAKQGMDLPDRAVDEASGFVKVARESEVDSDSDIDAPCVYLGIAVQKVVSLVFTVNRVCFVSADADNVELLEVESGSFGNFSCLAPEVHEHLSDSQGSRLRFTGKPDALRQPCGNSAIWV